MKDEARNPDREARDRARQSVYQFLSLALSDPRSKRWGNLLRQPVQEAAAAAAELLRLDPAAKPGRPAPGERPPEHLDLTPAIEALRASPRAVEEEHDRIFGLLSPRDCPPYETEYCPQTFSVFRSQKLGDVAGFYRAFGVEPSRDHPERHDHIALELEFMAWLIAKEQHAVSGGKEPEARICRTAQRRFFREHLAWWVPAFALALRRKADGREDSGRPARSFYGAVGSVLPAWIAVERAFLNVDPPVELVAPKAGDAEGPMCGSCGFVEAS